MNEGELKRNIYKEAALRAMGERKFRKNRFEDSYLSDRPFEAYEKIFGLTKDGLEGKTILDLGSGAAELFKRGADERGIKANIVSVNPKLGPGDDRGERVRRVSSKKNALAAIAEELPFKNESFDLVLSLAAVPLWLPVHEDDYAKAFREAARVLKSGGVIKLFPMSNFTLGLTEKVLREFRGSGYGVIMKEVELSEQELADLELGTESKCLVISKP